MADRINNEIPQLKKHMKFEFIAQRNQAYNWLTELSEYLSTIEKHLAALKNDVFERFMERQRKMGVVTVPDGTSIEEFFHSHRHAWPEFRFANLLRRSYTVLLYSIIETCLIDICSILSKQGDPRSIKDMKKKEKSYLKRASRYLTEVLEIKFQDDKQWEEINDLRRLRNCLVHDNGEVDDDSPGSVLLKNYIASHPFLDIGNKEIVIEQGYCEEILKIIKDFFDALFPKIFDFIKQNEDDVAPSEVMSDDEWMAINIGRQIGVFYLPMPTPDENIKIKKELAKLQKKAEKIIASKKARK